MKQATAAETSKNLARGLGVQGEEMVGETTLNGQFRRDLWMN